jgi:hypothetical protein
VGVALASKQEEAAGAEAPELGDVVEKAQQKAVNVRVTAANKFEPS